VVVSLISLSGGSLNDSKLERYLKRVHLDDSTPVEGYEKPALLIKRMERDGYVVRVKETGPSGEEDISWILGSRAKVEIGDDGVRGLTKCVYNRPEGAEGEELEKRIARSLGVGDRPADRQRQAEVGAEKPKRGRRRRDEKNGDDDEDDDESDDE
jgi:melanoma-associated antigen